MKIIKTIFFLLFINTAVAQNSADEVQDWLYLCDEGIVSSYENFSEDFKLQVSEDSWSSILKERNKIGKVISRELIASERITRRTKYAENNPEDIVVYEYLTLFEKSQRRTERVTVSLIKGLDLVVEGYYFK